MIDDKLALFPLISSPITNIQSLVYYGDSRLRVMMFENQVEIPTFAILYYNTNNGITLSHIDQAMQIKVLGEFRKDEIYRKECVTKDPMCSAWPEMTCLR